VGGLCRCCEGELGGVWWATMWVHKWAVWPVGGVGTASVLVQHMLWEARGEQLRGSCACTAGRARQA
jgi:hypothetical protein